MKKLVLILSALLFLIGTTDVQAQWGKKLLKKQVKVPSGQQGNVMSKRK